MSIDNLTDKNGLCQLLQKHNLNSLRTYARDLGVGQPTTKRKSQLIDSIVRILQGIERPVQKSRKGAPPKLQNLDLSGFNRKLVQNYNDSDISIFLNQTEFQDLLELIYLGSIIMDDCLDKRKVFRCNLLTDKILHRYCELFEFNAKTNFVSDNYIADLRDKIYDKVSEIIEKYELELVVEKIAEKYANDLIPLENYDSEKFVLHNNAEKYCKQVLKFNKADHFTVTIDSSNKKVELKV